MLYQPLNMHPSTFGVAGNGVIDATVANTFTALVDGGGTIDAYRLSIYGVDDLPYYKPNIIILTTPFDTCDYNGVMQTFEMSVPANPSYVDTSEEHPGTRTVTNGGTYKWILELWENYTPPNEGEEEPDPTVEGIAQLFRACSSPTLSINSSTAPAQITSKTNIWKATYTSTIQPSCFKWTLAETDSTNSFYKTVEETEWIYNSSKIWFKYDGLITGKYYAAKVSVVNQLNVETSTGWSTSYINYPLITMEGAIEVRQNGAALSLDWSGVSFIEGTAQLKEYPQTASTNYSVTDGMCHVGSDTFLKFYSDAQSTFKVECNPESSIALVVKLDPYVTKIENIFKFVSSDGTYSRQLDHYGWVTGLCPQDADPEHQISGLVPGSPVCPYEGIKGYYKYTIINNGVTTEYTIDSDYIVIDDYSAIVLNSNGIQVRKL